MRSTGEWQPSGSGHTVDVEVNLRQLNRSTLARQLLLDRSALTAVDALDRVVAIQAQEAASPYVALWNRISGFDPHEFDRAFDERVVVKAPLMRITLHAVTAADYSTLHEAMLPTLRAARLGDRRFAASGLTIADADEPEHLEGPGGATYYDVLGAEIPDGDVPAPPPSRPRPSATSTPPPGRAWKPRPPPCSPSSPTETPPSTVVSPTGGPSCRPVRCGDSQAGDAGSIPVRLLYR